MDSEPVRHIGVGIDTARYGHRVNFLREDKQLAAKAITVTENREGYDLLRAELETLHGRHSEAMFHVHIDAAGQYAANLEAFLRRLAMPMIDSTRAINRFHNLASRVFPELAMIVTDLDACSILDPTLYGGICGTPQRARWCITHP